MKNPWRADRDYYFCLGCTKKYTDEERSNLYYEGVRNIPPRYSPKELIRLEQIKEKEQFERNYPPKRIVRIWHWLTEPKISILAMMVGMLTSHFLIQLLTWGLR